MRRSTDARRNELAARDLAPCGHRSSGCGRREDCDEEEELADDLHSRFFWMTGGRSP